MKCPMRCLSLLLLLFLFTPWPVQQAHAATVVFDEGHGQRFLVGGGGPLQLSGLAGIFREKGARLVAQATPLTDESLAATDGLVLAGPFTPYSPSEIDAIARFLNRGGRVAVTIHIAPPLGPLLRRFGVSFSNGVIREREKENIIAGEPLNFRVTRFAPHPLMAGIGHFSLYGVWALVNLDPNVTIVASTSPDAWVDLDGDKALSPADAIQSFGVVVAGRMGKGQFVVFGDDAVFQNSFLDEENTIVARNLAAWLQGGNSAP